MKHPKLTHELIETLVQPLNIFEVFTVHLQKIHGDVVLLGETYRIGDLLEKYDGDGWDSDRFLGPLGEFRKEKIASGEWLYFFEKYYQRTEVEIHFEQQAIKEVLDEERIEQEAFEKRWQERRKEE